MNIGMWDSLYNIILLLFWNIIWSNGNFDMVRNPMLAPIVRIQNKATEFLKPVLPFLPDRIIATTAFLFLLVFRGAILPPTASWALIFGLKKIYSQGSGIATHILLSFLSYAIFTFKIWAISLIYIKTKQQASCSNNTDALFHLSKPFSVLEISIRPIVILLFGMVISYGLISLGNNHLNTSPLLITITKLAVLSLSGLVSILPIIRSLIFMMIIGSLLSSLMSSHHIHAFCREGIDTLIGSMRCYPIRIGMFDLTPIVFIFLLDIIYRFLTGILFNAVQSLS